MSSGQASQLGRFCWIELITNDVSNAVTFYSKLWGWKTNAMDDSGAFQVLQLGDEAFGATYALPQQLQDLGVTPRWLNYVAVNSAQDTADRIVDIGGSILLGPLAVGDAGVMAIAKDPEGATFALWQAKQHYGSLPFSKPGHYCWQELACRDLSSTLAFYQKVFGWELSYRESAMGQVPLFCVDQSPVASVIQMNEEWGDMAAHWMTYFASSDVDADLTQVNTLGGDVCVPGFDIPEVGRIAVVNDPQGVVLSMLQAS